MYINNKIPAIKALRDRETEAEFGGPRVHLGLKEAKEIVELVGEIILPKTPSLDELENQVNFLRAQHEEAIQNLAVALGYIDSARQDINRINQYIERSKI